MKKALMNASVASMIYKFNMDNIEILEKFGYQVDIACNFGKENPMNPEDINKFKRILKERNIRFFETSCPRKIMALNKMLSTYKQLKKIAKSEQYNLVHTQSPIGGVLCRLAFRNARKTGTKIIYTAHGFHFFKGSSLKSWFLFYPIEKYLSKYTDVLITINKEDYELAQKKMYATKTVYIPGVGVDLKKYSKLNVDKVLKRKELGIPQDAFLLLSVGELSPRKNHQIVIRALGEMKKKDIYYLIAGIGPSENEYRNLISQYGLKEKIRLLGHREDIAELCIAADCFVHPSVREGLGIAPLEGMACGLPLISSFVNGIKDYTKDGISGCCVNPLNLNDMIYAIDKMYSNQEFRKKCSSHNLETVKTFDLEKSKEAMRKIYEKYI